MDGSYIQKVTGEIFLAGNFYKRIDNLFSTPFPSSHVVVVVACEDLEMNTQIFSLSQLSQKCFVMPLSDGGVSSSSFENTTS